MFLLKHLQLKNFLSHSDTEIEFSENQKLLIDGNSGAGKTSIVEAMLWCLYGKSRSENRAIVKHKETMAQVSLTLENNDDAYRITRKTNTKGTTTLMVSKKAKDGRFLPVKITGVRATQDFIEKELLFSSYHLFVNSAIYPQDNNDSFVQQNATNRKELLMEIANIDNLNNYYELTKETIKVNEATKNSLEGSIAVLEKITAGETISKEEIDKMEKEKEEVNLMLTKIKVSTDSLEKQKKDLDDKIIKLTVEEKKLNNLKEDLARHEAVINDKQNYLPELITLDKDEIKKELEVFEKLKADYEVINAQYLKRDKWENEVMKLRVNQPVDLNIEEEVRDLNQQLIDLLAVKPDICPETNKECPYINEERQKRLAHLESILASKNQQKEKYLEDVNNYNKKLKELGTKPEVDMGTKDFLEKQIEEKTITTTKLKISLENNEEEIKKINEQIVKHTQESNSIKKEIDALSIQTKELDSLRGVSSEILEKVYKNNDLENVYRYKCEALTSNIESAKAKLEEQQKNDTELKGKKAALKNTENLIKSLLLLKEAFSNTGIKAMIIDFIVPELERRINEILKTLSGFSIKIDTQKEAATSGNSTEGLFITILNEQAQEFSFENLSGGEKLKITVAISEALAELQNVGFRIMDEMFLNLDEESADKFAEVLSALQDRFSQIICISHLRNIKDAFNDKIEVIKNNGTSVCVKK